MPRSLIFSNNLPRSFWFVTALFTFISLSVICYLPVFYPLYVMVIRKNWIAVLILAKSFTKKVRNFKSSWKSFPRAFYKGMNSPMTMMKGSFKVSQTTSLCSVSSNRIILFNLRGFLSLCFVLLNHILKLFNFFFR